MSANPQQPTSLQRFFASAWPYRLWFFSITIVAIIIVLDELTLSKETLADWTTWIWVLVAAILASLIGLFGGLLLAWLFLPPIFLWRARLNGAPFNEGDLIQILSGPHRGTLTRVYSKWQGETVRVELGNEAANTHEDVFGPTQLMRVTSTS